MALIETNEIMDSADVVKLLGVRDLNVLHYMMRKNIIRPMRRMGGCYVFLRSDVLQQWEAYQASRDSSSAA
jgi:hypothetical protein